MTRRCDLHVHSKRSDRPGEWYLERLGAPESFTEPLEVHRLARARGMDFVTVSDHDTIDGALEIAHLPGVFLSCEITAAFPEDGAPIHLLVWGIDEEEHRETQRLRGDLYELRGYLRERGIVHAVAHPLFRVDDRLGLDHLEKLLLLFRRFENLNGHRDPRATELFGAVATALDEATIDAMAERQGIAPDEPEPWIKRLTGGSDDHCGLYVATTWTETPECASVSEFLALLAAGDHRPGGEVGGSLKLARSFQTLAHDYYRARVLNGSRLRNDPLAELLRRLAVGEIRPESGGAGALVRAAQRLFCFLPPLGATRPMPDLTARASARRRAAPALAREEERDVFERSCRYGQRVAARAIEQAAAAFDRGQPIAAVQALSTLAPAVVALSPFVAAFGFQHRDEPLHRAVAERFPAAAHLRDKSERIAWATDTLDDVNGVAVTVRTAAAHARRRDLPVTVLACRQTARESDFSLESFPPIWQRPLPRYEELTLAVPPFLEMIETIERERFREIVVSTPGPVGLTALAAGKLLGLELTGVYHTDFPRYVDLFAGERFGEFARSYMRWFYGAMDRVFVSSRAYLDELVELGLERERLRLLPRGVDSVRFAPERRRTGFFERWGLGAGTTLLYVGRLTREKNLEVLLDAFAAVAERRPGVHLAIVGDGPARGALEARAVGGVAFTGYLEGDELAAAYASADLFVFPSRTDTFGNVVLEAMASGLPVLATPVDGAVDLVVDGAT
ncbi:MAG: glycosyltransferase, partial [Acidobacteria bacterium]|nr:glycosyltransferase [Acidobacteriota bacterium]